MKANFDIRSKNYVRYSKKYVENHAHGLPRSPIAKRPRSGWKYLYFSGITMIISSSSSYCHSASFFKKTSSLKIATEYTSTNNSCLYFCEIQRSPRWWLFDVVFELHMRTLCNKWSLCWISSKHLRPICSVARGVTFLSILATFAIF